MMKKFNVRIINKAMYGRTDYIDIVVTQEELKKLENTNNFKIIFSNEIAWQTIMIVVKYKYRQGRK